MRVLVVADIHGNRAALEAIREPCDVCVCVGDLVDYGPDPAWCIEWVRANATHCVRGNHDHGVAQNVEVHGVGGFRFLTAITRPLSVAAVSPSQRVYLAELPTMLTVSLGGKKFLLVHATPRDPMDEYAPPEVDFWKPRLAGLNVDFVLAGHTHVPYALRTGGITVVNPGSVGMGRDGDPRASFALIDGDDVQLKRVSYDVEATVRRVNETVPDATACEMLADVYRTGALQPRWLKKENGNGSGNGHPPATV